MEMDSSSAARGGSGRLPTKDGPPFVTETHIPSVIVRTAANADVDAMHELVRAAYSPYIPTLGYAPPPMRKNYTELLGKNPVWVAVDADGVLIGLLELIVEVDHVIVENLAVAPIYHGRRTRTMAHGFCGGRSATRGPQRAEDLYKPTHAPQRRDLQAPWLRGNRPPNGARNTESFPSEASHPGIDVINAGSPGLRRQWATSNVGLSAGRVRR